MLLSADPAADRQAIVAAWREFLTGRKLDHEILVVEHPAGVGAALRDGLAQAKHPLICYAPCQADYKPEFLGLLLDRRFRSADQLVDTAPSLEIDHVHLMSGYRAGDPVPWWLRLIGRVWRLLVLIALSHSTPPLPGWLGWRRHLAGWLARVIFAVPYRDVSCPFRLFRREILHRLPIQSDSAFAHVELLAKATFLGHLVAEEQPLDVRPGPYRHDARAIWADARRLFQQPDFGPPPVPQLTTGEAGS